MLRRTVFMSSRHTLHRAKKKASRWRRTLEAPWCSRSIPRRLSSPERLPRRAARGSGARSPHQTDSSFSRHIRSGSHSQARCSHEVHCIHHASFPRITPPWPIGYAFGQWDVFPYPNRLLTRNVKFLSDTNLQSVRSVLKSPAIMVTTFALPE